MNSVMFFVIGGILSILLLLVAESVNPQGWSLPGLLLYGFILGEHPYDQHGVHCRQGSLEVPLQGAQSYQV